MNTLISNVIWFLFSSLSITIFVVLFAGIIVVPLYRIHRYRRRRFNKPIGFIGRSFYFVPILALILVGTVPNRPTFFLIIQICPLQWILLLILISYICLSYMKRAEIGESINVIEWIKSWPGWFHENSSEPESSKSKSDITGLIAIPSIALLISLSDIIGRVSGFFLEEMAMYPIQFLLVAGSIGLAVHTLTATTQQSHPIMGKKIVLQYPRRARAACVIGAVFVVIIWATAVGFEIQSDLQIVSATLPEPEERKASLILINRGKEIRILKEFHIESRTFIPFWCLSADYNIPVVAEYKLAFHIADPFTVVQATPHKQFLSNTTGQVNIVLIPKVTGACADNWETKVRIFVVSGDGRRSATKWFHLKKNSPSRFPIVK